MSNERLEWSRDSETGEYRAHGYAIVKIGKQFRLYLNPGQEKIASGTLAACKNAAQQHADSQEEETPCIMSQSTHDAAIRLMTESGFDPSNVFATLDKGTARQVRKQLYKMGRRDLASAPRDTAPF